MKLEKMIELNTFARQYAKKENEKTERELRDGFYVTCFKDVNEFKAGDHYLCFAGRLCRLIKTTERVHPSLYLQDGFFNKEDEIEVDSDFLETYFVKGFLSRSMLYVLDHSVSVVEDLYHVRAYQYYGYHALTDERVCRGKDLPEFLRNALDINIWFIMEKNALHQDVFFEIKRDRFISAEDAEKMFAELFEDEDEEDEEDEEVEVEVE